MTSASADPASNVLFERLVAAHHRLLTSRGFDLFYGRQLLRVLTELGLIDVETEAQASIYRGGSSALALAWRLTFEQLQPEMLSTGLFARQEIKQGLALLADPAFTFLSQVTVAAWGWHPPSEHR